MGGVCGLDQRYQRGKMDHSVEIAYTEVLYAKEPNVRHFETNFNNGGFQAYRFDRSDAALKNFMMFFKKQSCKEHEQAEKLIKFQNQRGSNIELQDIKKPEQGWDSGLQSMKCALQLEKNINQHLLELHKLSKDRNDFHLCEFLETHYLEKQVKSIKNLGDHVTNLQRLGAPQNEMAEYLFDKHTLGKE